jgi:hypothetical protein
MLVHDVAEKLVEAIRDAFPEVDFDAKSVSFGAATHDIGKAVYVEELVGPGHNHEGKGRELLKERGVPEKLARFAYTHANWRETWEIQLEDLLVALADNCWKGKRYPQLEEEAVQVISKRTQREPWQVFAILDSVLEGLAADADRRLAWQAQFSADSVA